MKTPIYKTLKYITTVQQILKIVWETNKLLFLATLIIFTLSGLLPIVTAIILKGIIDFLFEALSSSNPVNFAEIGYLVGLQFLVVVVSQIVNPVGTYLSSEMTRQLILKTKSMIFYEVDKLDGLAYFENPKFHDLVRLSLNGSMSGPSRILDISTGMIRSCVTLISFIGIFILISPIISILVLVVSIIQIYVQFKFARKRVDLMSLNSPKERRAFYLERILSDVNFIKEVKFFNLGDYLISELLTLTKSIQNFQRNQHLYELRWQAFIEILTNLVTNIAFIFVIYQAFNKQITLGDVMLYTGALGSTQSALYGIVNHIGNLNQSVLLFNHVNEMRNLQPQLTFMQPAQPVPNLKIGIELKNVSFRYSSEQPWILRNINLFVPKNESVALVGINGAGKTTLVKLLTRLYDPTEGIILWDGIDIRYFDPKEYRRHLGVIFQDFGRYDMTVQENIGVGDVEKIEDIGLIKDAATDVGINDHIMRLPQEYRTVLSRWLVEHQEYGTNLSGGQWQKIALARMMLRDSEFLILDEPTASLDVQAEYRLYRSFTDLKSNKTGLIISHRFSTVSMADYIAVLEDNTISEYGSHKQLLAAGKTYANLHRMHSEMM